LAPDSFCIVVTGDVASIGCSDTTPDVTFSYARLGQQATVTDVTGRRGFAYSATTPCGWRFQ
jgi:hypothetical protein